VKQKYPINASILLLLLLRQVWDEMSEDVYVMLYHATYTDSISVVVIGRCNKKRNKASLFSAFSLTAWELNTYVGVRL